jgi:hypothetical protein
MMFRELNDQLKLQIPSYSGDPIFELHPAQLYGWMEAVWEMWRRLDEGSLASAHAAPSKTSAKATVVALGTVDRRSPGRDAAHVPVIGDPILALLRSRDAGLGALPNRLPLDVEGAARVVLEQMFRAGARKHATTPWLHLMYAYLIENTRVFEVMAKLLQGSLSDEPFGALSDRSFRWMRLTEELFFREGPASLVGSITSWLRPDIRATRRNAYQRMFGIDLNHGAADGGAYPYTKALVANGDFVKMLQELLRELWRGFVNARNTSGARSTDDANIEELLSKLQTMMTARRLSGGIGGGLAGRANLAREEFVAVSTLEWFEMAVDADSPIVADLKANGDEPEDRLRQLGERVKLASHGRSRSFFQLASRLPFLLREIEEGDWKVRPIVELYDPTVANTSSSRTTEIINHWSIATGVDLKSVPVASEPR